MMERNSVVVGIPSYNPDEKLIKCIESLIDIGFYNFIICDDGSREDSQIFFEKVLELKTDEIKISIVKHNINLGYGRAIKSIFNFFLGEYPDSIGIIQCDSDGQHIAKDVMKCAEALVEAPDSYYVGVRDFSKKAEIPFRSWFGNNVTSLIFRFFCGINIKDTQTGLRAIPKSVLSILMETEGERFEYTTNILLNMKDNNIQIKQISINTIYLENNSSSHFNPVVDSIRIYSRIFKYCFSSLMTACIDIFVFSLVVGYYAKFMNSYIIAASITAVIFSGIFNFCFNKLIVFKNMGNVVWQAAKYTGLCLIHAVSSALLIGMLDRYIPIDLVAIKIIVDTVLFFVTYYIQGRFVFRIKDKKNNTNWNQYYTVKKSKVSNFTQGIQYTYLKEFMKENIGNEIDTVIECGGGSSCIFEKLVSDFKIMKYKIIDYSEAGVKKFVENTASSKCEVSAECKDLLNDDKKEQYDIAISLGLIEHFEKESTEIIIKKHFDYTKQGGFVVITFPTPTKQYLFIRKIMELLHVWQFWDERPLKCEEVEYTLNKCGKIKAKVLMRKMPLTQMLYIVEKA